MNNFEDYKNRVDQVISNQDDPLSIPPEVVGKKLKELAVITEKELNALITGLINAEIGVEPPTNITSANVSVAGTYPFYNGLEVSSEDLSLGLVQFRKVSDVWTKVITPIELSAYLKKDAPVQIINTKFKSLLPGNVDSLRGPYPDLTTANTAIPNTMIEVDGILTSYRKGKFVEIGVAGVYNTYWWNGADYANDKLVEYFSELTKKSSIKGKTGKNLLNKSTVKLNHYLNKDNNEFANVNYCYSARIKVEAGKTYTGKSTVGGVADGIRYVTFLM